MEYRKNVGIMIINSEGKVFMAKRKKSKYDIDDNKSWQMPQGGIDSEETPDKAVYREMMEEVGTNNVELIYTSKNWYNYNFPNNVLSHNPLPFKGQTQKWFLFKFLGDDSEFDFETHNPEFIDFKWVDIDNIADMVIDFKSGVYKNVAKEFKPIIKDLLD
jgi:putative (di)nucleoside polyphosphate hydrolase